MTREKNQKKTKNHYACFGQARSLPFPKNDADSRRHYFGTGFRSTANRLWQKRPLSYRTVTQGPRKRAKKGVSSRSQSWGGGKTRNNSQPSRTTEWSARRGRTIPNNAKVAPCRQPRKVVVGKGWEATKRGRRSIVEEPMLLVEEAVRESQRITHGWKGGNLKDQRILTA